MDILVVDDDRDIADIIGYSLRKEGHRPILAYSGEEALALAERSRPDLVVLDVMLPGLSGFDVCRKLRERGPIPVILLTARGEEADRVWGLDLGADDYMTKPFSHRELLARIRAVARRSAAAETPDQGSVTVGELEIDFGATRSRCADGVVDLTPKEYEILHCLALNAGGWCRTSGCWRSPGAATPWRATWISSRSTSATCGRSWSATRAPRST